MDTRPPGNSFSHFYLDNKRKEPSPNLELAWTKLREKIKKLKPNIVIALGAEPLRAITNKISIKNWRGSLIPILGTKMIATYHPSMVLRKYQYHPKLIYLKH
jgi:uracil-DNA glycosylase